MTTLTGKVAIISGGTSGIGLAAAQRLVAEGAYVFIFGRRQAQLDEAKKIIGSNVTAIQADAASLEDLDRVIAQVRADKGTVDIVLTSAAFIEQAPIDTASPEHFDTTFDTNVRGPFFLVQKALPLMSNGGSIILVASAMHVMGIPQNGTYAATKAALRSFVRTWAAEFKDRGIRVNTLSPGVIDTPILDVQAPDPKSKEALVNMYKSIIPFNRLGRPEEMANAIYFLASDQSSYMTGSDLMVDGGAGQV